MSKLFSIGTRKTLDTIDIGDRQFFAQRAGAGLEIRLIALYKKFRNDPEGMESPEFAEGLIQNFADFLNEPMKAHGNKPRAVDGIEVTAEWLKDTVTASEVQELISFFQTGSVPREEETDELGGGNPKAEMPG